MLRLYSDRRVSRLEERIEKLESELKSAALDFDELYQKCRKLLGRTVKERASIESAHQPEAASVVPEGQGNVRGFLTDNQRAIQQQILKRRGGG